MILQLSPDTPLLIRAAAASVLIMHIGAGGAGLLSGAAAFAVRKGGRLHRLAGGVFVVSMLVMSGIGAAVSPFLPQRTNVVPGLFTFYLVATGWMAARRRDDPRGRFEIAGMLFALAIVATGVNFGLMAAHNPTGRLDGDAPSDYYTFAALPALACALDLHVILRRRLASSQRMARHIWRMGLALLIAALSLFIGQPKVFPPGLRGAPVMFVPEAAVLALTVFWLVRIRFKTRLTFAPRASAASAAPPSGAPVSSLAAPSL